MNDLANARSLPTTDVMLGDASQFEHAQRVAKVFAQSELVPERYRGTSQAHVANVMLALNMANRLGADPLMVMQNLYVVHGQPAWSTKFLIGTVNSCGRYRPLRYEFDGEPHKPTWQCRAWTTELDDPDRAPLYGPPVTWKMATDEGWIGRKGSKWQTMPELMLAYRAAAFWTRLHAPELSLGLHTRDELLDTGRIVVEHPPADVTDLNRKLLGEAEGADNGEML